MRIGVVAALSMFGLAAALLAQRAGPGIALIGDKIAVDDTVIPSYSVGADAPVGSCRAGADFFVDRSRNELYFCPDGEYAALAGRAEPQAGEAILLPAGEMRAVSRQALSEAGEVRVAQVRLPAPIEVHQLSFVTAAAASGARVAVGLYSLRGQLLASGGPVTGNAAPLVTVLVRPGARLDAGVYWLAWTADRASAELVTEAPPAPAFAELRNAGSAITRGIAINSSEEGRLPSVLDGVRRDDGVLCPIVKLAH